jgi:hypothetical protein
MASFKITFIAQEIERVFGLGEGPTSASDVLGGREGVQGTGDVLPQQVQRAIELSLDRRSMVAQAVAEAIRLRVQVGWRAKGEAGPGWAAQCVVLGGMLCCVVL